MIMEFAAKKSPDGKIEIPATIAETIPDDEEFQVVILLDKDREEEKAFMRAGLKRFFEDDSPLDAIYDRL